MKRQIGIPTKWFTTGLATGILSIWLFGMGATGRELKTSSATDPVPTSRIANMEVDQASNCCGGSFVAADQLQPASDKPLKVICFGAHPDDCELRAAGMAAKWAAAGHRVKFVSLTNGDIGHWMMAGGPLAQRRLAEVRQCAKILGIETEVLDIHDGELLPTLETRKVITQLIRQWDADMVICHRPNDYHPDHRNVGLVVQDAAYMVTVPYFCPDTPPLRRNPVFLYFEDRFQKPNPFSADVVVSIDSVIDQKLATVDALRSQFYEGGCCSGVTQLPKTDKEKELREKQVRTAFTRRFASTADRFRKELVVWYGQEQASKTQFAEAFEVCEYGRRPNRQELERLFLIPAK